jgi:3-dehydrosphinganine reductase
MARENKKGGKIVLVSSTLGYMSFIGWASYSPAKHALRGMSTTNFLYLMLALKCNVGLADTLQSELMLYGVDVHIFFPGVMYTPGYEEENKMKPHIVKTIEGTDDGLTAEQAALALFKGE